MDTKKNTRPQRKLNASTVPIKCYKMNQHIKLFTFYFTDPILGDDCITGTFVFAQTVNNIKERT